MKTTLSILSLALIFMACQPPVDNSAMEAFEKNSQTVLAYMESWENESMDYDAFFSEDYQSFPTAFGSTDSMNLDAIKESNMKTWAAMDFKKPEDLVFLPGVNADSKKMDGSVRYYGAWKVSLPATDSTEEVSGVVKVYQSFDFNDDGKFALVQSYGDWGGMNNYFAKAAKGEDYEYGDDGDDGDSEDSDGGDE